MGISDEELLDEVLSFEFNSCFVNVETEDFENPSDDLEETDPVASLNDKGGGAVRTGVIDGDG